MKESARGAIVIFLTYVLWGILPVYWKALASINSSEILAHRIVWSCVFSFILVAAARKTRDFVSLFRNRRELVTLMVSSVVVTGNWGLYIWAVNSGKILESSLGYFINPLISILLGTMVFKERLSMIQWLSIGVATVGVCAEVVELGHFPFVSLGLALLFGIYGLFKKLSAIESTVAFTVETLLITPFALLWLIWRQSSGAAHFPYDLWTTVLLIGTGIATSMPLIMFAWGVKRSAMTTVGLIQYTSPILMFITGTLVYHEPVSNVRLLSFTLIWISIIFFTVDSFLRAKKVSRTGQQQKCNRIRRRK
ncbi:MAG: EamA family transporter RarD [Synergistaceae bacterium]|nr:EamA family transporter RarD [Synergistaceae bacterium]